MFLVDVQMLKVHDPKCTWDRFLHELPKSPQRQVGIDRQSLHSGTGRDSDCSTKHRRCDAAACTLTGPSRWARRERERV